MSAFDEYVMQQVREKTPATYPETKAEIVEYYQERFSKLGRGGWKQELIKDLLPFTKQTGKDPAKNLARRFDPSRIDNVPRRHSEKAEYKNLGKTLEPLEVEIPEGGYEITFIGEILISDKCCPRDFSIIVDGEEAEELFNTGSSDILFKYYWEGKDDNPAEGVCGNPQVIVNAL